MSSAPADRGERALIEDLGLALVREYLAKRKYKNTLDMLASELVSTQREAQQQQRQSRPAQRLRSASMLMLVPVPLAAAFQTRADHDHRTGQESRHHQVREQEQQGR